MEEHSGSDVALDFLPIALRAYTERINRVEKPKSSRRRSQQEPQSLAKYALVLDTETTIDRSQRLLFGSYRLLDLKSGDCFGEGLFYDGLLWQIYPDGMCCLREYVKVHRAETIQGRNLGLRLISAREFLDRVLWPSAQLGALIVGFNLPFDLSRLAEGWSEAKNSFRGGFSFQFWKFKDKKTGKSARAGLDL